MATLTGSAIADSFDQLLALPSGGGATTTLKALTDGNADTTFAMQLSTTTICIDNPTASSSTQGGILRLQSDDGAVMASGHRLGVIEFSGAEDTSNTITTGARIEAVTDATWSASENGADMVFYTTDGNAAQAEHLRIKSGSAVNLVITGGSTHSQVDFAGSDGTKDGSIYAEATNIGFLDDDGNWAVRAEADVQTSLYVNNSIKLLVDANSRISLSNNDSGADNTVFGFLAGASLGSGHDRNVLIGDYAGTNVAADSNVLIGRACGDAITSGASNVAIGDSALGTADTALQNIVIGGDAMSAVPASQAVSSCIAIGVNAAKGSASTTTGIDGTVAVGHSALAALTSGAGNTAIGYQAGLAMTAGGENTILGYQAFIAADNDEFGNVAIGYAAMGAVNDDSADDNVCIGRSAGYGGAALMKGCVAIGREAMENTAGNAQTGTIAIGYKSLEALTTGAGNVAVGYQAMLESTTGEKNTVVGHQAAAAFDAGESKNVVIGWNAGLSLDGGVDDNVIIGHNAGVGGAVSTIAGCVVIGSEAMNSTLTSDQTGTIAIGKSALTALTSGAGNVAIGYQAADALTTGGTNTVVGNSAFSAANGTESSNTVIGYNAMTDADHDDADNNVVIGAYAGDEIGANAFANSVVIGFAAVSSVATSAASGTVSIGYSALKALTSGASNTAIGYNAALTHTTGGGNTIMGHSAFSDTNAGLNSLASANNVAIGVDAMGGTWADSQTDSCVAIGHGALDGALDNVDGSVAVGAYALGGLTTGQGNIGIGLQAMLRHTTGGRNIAFGNNTMSSTHAGSTSLGSVDNIFMGYNSGSGTWADAASNSNVGIGNYTMDAAMNGALNNTGVGYNALTALTTGDGNTSMGYNSGDTITTGGYNTIIGNSADSGAAGASNRTAIGHEAVGQADNSVTLGNASVTDVYMAMNVGARFTIGTGGAVTMPNQPAFQVIPASTQTNIATGGVTIVFGTERFDQGADFATNTFTAPVTGKYQLDVNIYVDNIDTAAGYYQLELTTSNKTYYSVIDPNLSGDAAYWSFHISVLADMDASDTASVGLHQSSGTAQTDIATSSNFSGYLAC